MKIGSVLTPRCKLNKMVCFVYIVRCKDDSLYTGITWNLRKRLREHNQGGTPFTKNKLPIKLVYWETFSSRKEVAKREKEIKGWRREKKEKLISNFKSLH